MKLSDIYLILEKMQLTTSILSQKNDINIEHISCDSRDIKKNTLFFCKGVAFKRDYLINAIINGAIAYISEVDLNVDIPFISVNKIRLAMPLVAKYFYNNPAKRVKLTGITGTKGKTTCACMLKNILEAAYGVEKVGIINNIEAVSGTKKLKKSMNTPESLELYGILNSFAKDKLHTAVIEVSSQGLQYNRIEYIDFFTGIYLNLSPDHISPTEHKNFDEYKNAKKRMLTLCENGIVNIDDEYAAEMIKASSCERLITFGVNNNADFMAKNIKSYENHLIFDVYGKYISELTVETSIPGDFNVYNALAAISASWLLDVKPEHILTGLKNTTIPGRMELFKHSDSDISILVDYAHNMLSFNGVFDYINKFFADSRIITVFGCQGNKALDRRLQLPEIVGKRSDFSIITSDDPANEDPETIINEVEKNLKKYTNNYIKITDREEAVKYAVSMAKQGDIIFLAGKGPETTQQVKNKSEFFAGDMFIAKNELLIKEKIVK